MADKEPRQPTHRAYSVIRREGQDDYWLNIGLVFPHKDNGGFNIMLQAFPLDGKIVCRITQWFADAANGIGDFFAKRIVGDQLCARKSDGSLECLTGDQLAALLESAGQSATPASSPSSGGSSSDPATTPTPESSTSPEPSDAATSSPAVTESAPPVTEPTTPIVDSPPLAPEEEPEPEAGAPTALDTADSTEPPPATHSGLAE